MIQNGDGPPCFCGVVRWAVIHGAVSCAECGRSWYNLDAALPLPEPGVSPTADRLRNKYRAVNGPLWDIDELFEFLRSIDNRLRQANLRRRAEHEGDGLMTAFRAIHYGHACAMEMSGRSRPSPPPTPVAAARPVAPVTPPVAITVLRRPSLLRRAWGWFRRFWRHHG